MSYETLARTLKLPDGDMPLAKGCPCITGYGFCEWCGKHKHGADCKKCHGTNLVPRDEASVHLEELLAIAGKLGFRSEVYLSPVSNLGFIGLSNDKGTTTRPVGCKAADAHSIKDAAIEALSQATRPDAAPGAAS